MKKVLPKYLFLFFVLCGLALPMKATHIVGGEIIYDDLGGNNYKITLKCYRDFSGINFDNPATIFIYDAFTNLIDTIQIPFYSEVPVPPAINNPCVLPPNFIQYRFTEYVIPSINLPPILGGYYLVYQRCCRNGTILNLINPGGVGSTYIEHINGPEVVTTNNSPRFNTWPPIYICNGIDIAYDHSATDPDGDSLVYSLCDAYNALDACCPILGPQAFGVINSGCPPPSCPVLGLPPPYSFVPYLSPYNGSYPLSSNPAIAVNSQTGYMTGTPNINGQWVVAVCCSEYRNGVLIGVHRRDFQFNVVTCLVNVVAAAQVPVAICGNNSSASFTNNSTGTNIGSYSWNFGDLTTSSDTSNAISPSYAYPATGVYTVTLIAYDATNALCNDTATTTVSISNSFSANFTTEIERCEENRIKFYATANFPSGTTANWSWNFGDNSTSTLQNPEHVYASSGTFNIVLISFVAGSVNCYDTVTSQSITIYKPGEFYIPNTFTPNNDGVNDVFRVRGQPSDKFYFAVYNRWGEMVFETEDFLTGWDGVYKGKLAEQGVYGYYVKSTCQGKESVFKKGNVTLIR